MCFVLHLMFGNWKESKNSSSKLFLVFKNAITAENHQCILRALFVFDVATVNVCHFLASVWDVPGLTDSSCSPSRLAQNFPRLSPNFHTSLNALLCTALYNLFTIQLQCKWYINFLEHIGSDHKITISMYFQE